MKLVTRGLIRRAGSTRGNAVVEFALVLPLLLLLVFGITELGRMTMTTNILNTAAREGARLAAVSDPGEVALVQARVTEVCTAAKVAPTAIDVVFDVATNSVTVTVNADFEILSRSALPLPLRGTIPLVGTCVFRYEG